MSHVARRAIAFAVLTALVTLTTAVLAPSAAADTSAPPGQVAYEPPVDAPVARGFEAPATPYGSGHRGLEYDTGPGVPVRTAAPGTVAFAGIVAGRRWVTVAHADGVRTTYGPLASVDVQQGADVEGGAVVGTTAGPLLFTARIGDAYVDPAVLLGTAGELVRLVPDTAETVSGYLAHHERTTVLDRLRGVIDPGALAAAVEWEASRAGAAMDSVAELTPAPVVRDTVVSLLDWRRRQQDCSPPSAVASPPAGRRVAVLVGGLGSSSTNAAVDDVPTSFLGYDGGDVVRFSYAGGRVPTSSLPEPELRGIDEHAYEPSDTVGPLVDVGHRLAQLLAAVVDAEAADVVVDVYGHSQGGLVTRLALDELARDRPDVVERLGVVASMASPFGGADLATLATRLAADPLRGPVVQGLGDEAGLELHLDDPAIRDLAPGSDVVRSLAGPPPPGPRYVAIAGRGDLVVPAPRAAERGASNVVVPVGGSSAHASVPGAPATARELQLALAGEPPACESAADAILDGAVGSVVAHGEALLAAAG